MCHTCCIWGNTWVAIDCGCTFEPSDWRVWIGICIVCRIVCPFWVDSVCTGIVCWTGSCSVCTTFPCRTVTGCALLSTALPNPGMYTWLDCWFCDAGVVAAVPCRTRVAVWFGDNSWLPDNWIVCWLLGRNIASWPSPIWICGCIMLYTPCAFPLVWVKIWLDWLLATEVEFFNVPLFVFAWKPKRNF